MAKSEFRPKLSKAERQKFLVLPKAILHQVMIERLSFIGETFVKNARINGNYKDITGNLRSGIYFIVGFDGKPVAESDTKIFATGTEGSIKGKSYAEELLAQYPKDYVLICVAGMEYASAVESRGRDVITGSALQAKIELLAAIKELKNKLKGAA